MLQKHKQYLANQGFKLKNQKTFGNIGKTT